MLENRVMTIFVGDLPKGAGLDCLIGIHSVLEGLNWRLAFPDVSGITSRPGALVEIYSVMDEETIKGVGFLYGHGLYDTGKSFVNLKVAAPTDEEVRAIGEPTKRIVEEYMATHGVSNRAHEWIENSSCIFSY